LRIGVSVKTGSVGDGVSAADLTAAVQNTLAEYLKGTNIEVVPLEAKLASLIDGEARKKNAISFYTRSLRTKKAAVADSAECSAKSLRLPLDKLAWDTPEASLEILPETWRRTRLSQPDKFQTPLNRKMKLRSKFVCSNRQRRNCCH
jgi:hypothetical protein